MPCSSEIGEFDYCKFQIQRHNFSKPYNEHFKTCTKVERYDALMYLSPNFNK